MQWVLGVLISIAMAGCSRPNPRFDADGDVLDFTGGADDLGGTTDGGTAVGGTTTDAGAHSGDSGGGSSEETRGSTGLETGGATATLHVFASGPSNGSLDFDGRGEVERADAQCASIDAARDVPLCGPTIRAFVFVDPVPLDQQIPEALGLPKDQPVEAANGLRVADSLATFVAGPHIATLPDADVVPATELGVWTGLNLDEPGNCQSWTSGNDERRGGVGALHGNAGWAAATLASCDTDLPILCLCD